MDLSIIIVSFNVKELLRECLESLISNFQFPISNYEIIVVDNASDDGSVEMLCSLGHSEPCPDEGQDPVSESGSRNEFGTKILKSIQDDNKNLTLILNKENLGFAKATNQGIKKSRGEYILLLNPDIVVKRGTLQTMVNFAQTHPLAGVVGGRLLNPDGSVQASVYHFPSIIRAIREFWFNSSVARRIPPVSALGDEPPLRRRRSSATTNEESPSLRAGGGFNQKDTYQKYTPQPDQPVVVDAVTGSVMLTPRKVIEQVGMLDERYFMYFEDLDYCRRVKKAGYKTYYLPQVEFVHYHGASGKKIPELTHRWLIQSSKVYNGLAKYYLLTLIIWLGQKWQKFLGRR